MGTYHQGYFDTLTKLVADTVLANVSFEKVIAETAGKADKVAIFNQCGANVEHTFYWRSLRPQGGGQPRGVEAKDRGFIRQCGCSQEGAGDGGDDPVRQRLGLTCWKPTN